MKLPLCLLLVAIFSSISIGQSSRDEGVALFRQGKYSESIVILDKVFSSDSADYPTGMYLGASYLKNGNERKAAETFVKAQTLKKSDVVAVKYDKKIQLTNRPQARFSDRAMDGKGAGLIRLAVEFKGDGTLGFIFPFEASSPTLVDDAVKTAKQIKFKPAELNGEPVPVVMVIEYSFSR